MLLFFMSYFVYILRTSSDTLYIGQTNNLTRRLEEHQTKSARSAKYLRRFTSVELVYSEKYFTRKEAMQRETHLKTWSKTKKEALVSKHSIITNMTKLNSKQLRKSNPEEKDYSKIKRNPIYLVLDEVLDTYNIGSIFRLADAIAAEKIYLCGNMEFPPSSRIHKSAVGTENWILWEKRETALEVVQELKSKNIQTIAVEQDRRAISYKDLNIKLKFPCAIILGHETNGIKQEVLDEVDVIVELPMAGINKSFNVWGSGAIIAYKILENLD